MPPPSHPKTMLVACSLSSEEWRKTGLGPGFTLPYPKFGNDSTMRLDVERVLSKQEVNLVFVRCGNF